MGTNVAKPYRKTIRRTRITRVFSAVMLVAVLGAGFIAINKDVALRTSSFRPTIGLVNEDVAATFNGIEYTFGANFVDRISKDTEYNWTVLSRPVAEKAYADGSVDAVIYLPQSFTGDILTLQEFTPTKATVEYKLRHQISEQADRLLDNKITGIVDGFNQGVVKMYYSSVADSVAEADSYMNAALANQEALIKALTADIHEPFSGTMPNFESLVTSAKGLKDVDAATTEAQNTFAQSATDTLTKTSESFAGKLPEIDEYTKRQKDIAQINATNSNKGITNQAAADQSFYGTQYDQLQTSTLCALTGSDAAGAVDPCKLSDGSHPVDAATLFGSLKTSIADYENEYQRTAGILQPRLPMARTDLDSSIAQLQYLKSQWEVPADPADPNSPMTPTIDPVLFQILEDEILNLQTVRGLLNVDDLQAPPFTSHVNELDSWHVDTVQRAKDFAMVQSTVTNLEVKDWGSYDPDGTHIYTDSSDVLQNSLTDMVQRAADSSSKIAASKLTLPDNGSLFDALLKNANGTFDGARSVQNGVETLVTDGGVKLGENQAFTRNFSTVLANTRVQGVDSGQIHDFFAAPIKAQNITPARDSAGVHFDLKWAYLFGGGLLTGALGMLFASTFRKRLTKE